MKKYLKELEDLRQYALKIGASRIAVLPTDPLVIRHSARAKCYIPACKFYGSSIMCPPHNSLTPEITRKMVSEYSAALYFIWPLSYRPPRRPGSQRSFAGYRGRQRSRSQPRCSGRHAGALRQYCGP